MKILGIETSCDETAVALIDGTGAFNHDFEYTILGNALLSQVKEHAQYGGVFPSVAKREHGRNLVPVLGEVLRQANLLDAPPDTSEDVIKSLEMMLEREPELFSFLSSFLRSTGKPPIDCIAVTVGPGLEPALWVGINFAKALSLAWNVPIVPINHMEGHIILSALLSAKPSPDKMIKVRPLLNDKGRTFIFPLLSLLISGGHTELVLSREWMKYEIIGQTRDDAVGEAFDKVARLMGLPYPGGPEISRLATATRAIVSSQTATLSAFDPRRSALRLPRPMIDSPDYDFSFSGLKTAVRRIVESHQPLSEELRMALSREFEDAVAEVLVAKMMRAVEECNVQTILVGGGVSANKHIRMQLSQAIQDYGSDARLLMPPPELATDNALMIALAGYFRATNDGYTESAALTAQGNLKLA